MLGLQHANAQQPEAKCQRTTNLKIKHELHKPHYMTWINHTLCRSQSYVSLLHDFAKMKVLFHMAQIERTQVLLCIPHRSINQTFHYSMILNTYMFTSATLSVCMFISFVTTTRWTRLVVMYNRCLRRLDIQWIRCIIRIFFFRHTVNIVSSQIVQKHTVLINNTVHVFVNFISHRLKTMLTYLNVISSFESCNGECLCGLFVISPSSLWSSTSISETSYSDMTITSYSYFHEHTKHVLQSLYTITFIQIKAHTNTACHLWSET